MHTEYIKIVWDINFLVMYVYFWLFLHKQRIYLQRIYRVTTCTYAFRILVDLLANDINNMIGCMIGVTELLGTQYCYIILYSEVF